MDIQLYLVVVIIVSSFCVFAVILYTSLLANQNVKETLLDLWHTFFGSGRPPNP